MVSFLNGFRRSPSALISPCGKLYSKKLSDTVTQVQLLISRIRLAFFWLLPGTINGFYDLFKSSHISSRHL